MTDKKTNTNISEARVVGAGEKKEERLFEQTLRPKKLSEFIGQERLKKNLGIFLEAARRRKEPPEHILFYGNAGLGKTTLAHIIAYELGVNSRVIAGPTIERVGDLAAIITNLEPGDVLFIDECHRLGKNIEEVLYPAMEEYALDIVIGKGPSARTLRLDLPKFTLIGATTRLSLLSAPLRDRFGVTYHLKFYSQDDIARIIDRSAKILNVEIDKEACREIAKRARFTPRVANRLLKRVRDFAQVKERDKIEGTTACAGLEQLDIDEYGLDHIDREILKIIIEKFNGGPVGLSTISAATREEIDTIEEIYEPFLIQLGFLNRTPRGRIVTELAYRHLGIRVPQNPQKNLL